MKTKYIIAYIALCFPFLFLVMKLPSPEPACMCPVGINATYEQIIYKFCCKDNCRIITSDHILNLAPIELCWIRDDNTVTMKPLRKFEENYFLYLFLYQIMAGLIPILFRAILPELASFEYSFLNFFISLIVALISGFINLLQVESDTDLISFASLLLPFLLVYIMYRLHPVRPTIPINQGPIVIPVFNSTVGAC